MCDYQSTRQQNQLTCRLPVVISAYVAGGGLQINCESELCIQQTPVESCLVHNKQQPRDWDEQL